MIVSDNANLYGSLFEKANAALGFNKDEDKITNIDEYFTCIKRLSDYERDNKTDPIFTILPVNEDTFDIDANTRKIDIPTSFMTSGIGVKGDEVAEILYFTIDRYFDIADLYHKDILIQWKNAAGDEGLSLTINKSLSYKPGKVTFGWPISSEITNAAGNVQFAVRFYDRFEDDVESYLTYSFSTLTAIVKVNPSLDFDISNEDNIANLIVDRTQKIFDNLKDSAATGVINPAAMPVFEIELSDEKNLDELTQVVIINGEEKKVFMVKAYIPEDAFGAVGNIKYSWEHRDKDGVVLETPVFGDYYIETEDLFRNDRDTYYEKTEDGSYIIFMLDDFEPGKTYYEKYSYCIPTGAGIYKVTATNVAGRVSTAKIEDSCLVPYAKNVNYSIDDASIILNKKIVDGVIQNEYESKTITYNITQNDKGVLSYQWKYNPDPTLNGNNIANAQILNEKTSNTLEVNQLGYYWLIVTNKYNNDENINIPTVAIRVTEEPTLPTIIGFNINGESKALTASTQASLNNKIGYMLGTTLNTDNNYKYQWLKQNIDEWAEVEGATSEFFTPATIGTYACRIINVYNEEEAFIETINNVINVF